MTIFKTFLLIFAAALICAAYTLIGYLIGRKTGTPGKKKLPQLKQTRAENTEEELRRRKEYENFMNYAGEEQEPIVISANKREDK